MDVSSRILYVNGLQYHIYSSYFKMMMIYYNFVMHLFVTFIPFVVLHLNGHTIRIECQY